MLSIYLTTKHEVAESIPDTSIFEMFLSWLKFGTGYTQFGKKTGQIPDSEVGLPIRNSWYKVL